MPLGNEVFQIFTKCLLLALREVSSVQRNSALAHIASVIQKFFGNVISQSGSSVALE